MKWYWPELTDLKESEKAAHEGAGVCFLVAGGTAIIAGMSVWLDKPVLGMDVWALVDAGIFAIAGWRIWRLSRIWAVLALATFIAESINAIALHPLPAVFLIRGTLTLVLIGSVRGTFAYHRFRSNALKPKTCCHGVIGQCQRCEADERRRMEIEEAYKNIDEKTRNRLSISVKERAKRLDLLIGPGDLEAAVVRIYERSQIKETKPNCGNG